MPGGTSSTTSATPCSSAVERRLVFAAIHRNQQRAMPCWRRLDVCRRRESIDRRCDGHPQHRLAV